jgi:collagen beta-1,O-galactosyltransferase
MNIDKIYVINLKDNIDRKNNVTNILNKLNLDNYIITEAVNGKELNENVIKNYLSPFSLNTLSGNYKSHSDIRKVGEIGCYLSHYNIWKDIIIKGYNNAIIFEDDININVEKDVLNEYLLNLPKDYDIAYLGYITIPLNSINKSEINNNYWERGINNIFGTHSYILSNKGCKKLLEKVLPINEQIDAYINYYSYYDNNFNKYIPKKQLFITNSNMNSTMHQLPCIKCVLHDLVDKNIIITIIFIIFILICIIWIIYKLFSMFINT